MLMGYHMPQTEKFSWQYNQARIFLVEKFVFCESKKFLSQGVCMIKFLFFEGIQNNVFTIICQSFTILSGCGRVVEIFYSQNLSFVSVKNFYLRVCAR